MLRKTSIKRTATRRLAWVAPVATGGRQGTPGSHRQKRVRRARNRYGLTALHTCGTALAECMPARSACRHHEYTLSVGCLGCMARE
jgi:hypothetical protein